MSFDSKRARVTLSGLSNDGREDGPWKAKVLPKMHCWEIVDANGHNVATCMDTLSHRPMFIAESRTLVPSALDEIARLRALALDACDVAEPLTSLREAWGSDKERARARLAAIRAAIGKHE